MDLLVVPVPFFNKDTSVMSYYVRFQRGNDLLEANRTSSMLDGKVGSPLMETLNVVGLDSLTMGNPLFVPINNLTLLVMPEYKCNVPPEKIIFVLDYETKAEAQYLNTIKLLKERGFRFAMRRLPMLDEYKPVLDLCDYFLISAKAVDSKVKLFQLKKEYAHIDIVMTHVEDMDTLKKGIDWGCKLFEGKFYSKPFTQREKNDVSPLKANLIRLLNLVQDENFEFREVAKIVQRDTALTISLMRMVNSPYLGLRQKVKDINHAVTILGLIEVRKWVTTAVSKLLGSDKPDEITRLSLIRAKFAENLAFKFDLAVKSPSVFLMGLFSVLDVILDVPMAKALDMVMVSDEIREALIDKKGRFYKVLDFIIKYEQANWSEINRLLIFYDLTPEDIYESYINALCWYRDLIAEGMEKEDSDDKEK